MDSSSQTLDCEGDILAEYRCSMRLRDYVPEIEHAVGVVVTELHQERDDLNRASHELARLTKLTEDAYRKVEFLRNNPDMDDDWIGTAIYWDTYFGPDKERYHKADEVGQMRSRIAVKRFSLSALSGNLLQYAKQGISLQYEGPDKCPDGRTVEGLPLKEVIWCARNQALHWEEGKFSTRTTACMDHLKARLGGPFNDYTSRSIASEIVDLLGWKTVDDFKRDMLSLDP